MDKTLKKISSEWVGAPVTQSLCERKIDRVKETFTPSDRVLRPRPVTKLVEDQASDVKLATENMISSVKQSSCNEAKQNKIQNTKTQIGCKTIRCLHQLSRNKPTELIGICFLISSATIL